MTRKWRAAALILLLCVAASAPALAQGANPLGVPAPAGPAAGGPVADFLAWVYAWQLYLQRALTAAVKALKTDPQGVWFLAGFSFLYGVFHAAGPGHGKAVLTSYMLADGASVKRGIALAVAAAIVQAFSAIALVLVLAVAINATGLVITRTANHLETASYAAITLFGAWLLWRKGRAAFGRGHDHHHDHAHDHGYDGHGHAHAPDPRALAGEVSLARMAAIALAMGLRPCSGAILVLLFALAQGVFLAGIGATFAMAAGTGLAVAVLAVIAVGFKAFAVRVAGADTPAAGRVVGGIELVGALLVFALGAILLAAALSGGRAFTG